MFDRISIRSNEDVLICGNVIGNISRQSIKEILRSTKADEIRHRLKKCDKNCIHNCRTQGSLKDKTKLLLKYLNK
jgi:flagellar biosynthesis regulator FlbT